MLAGKSWARYNGVRMADSVIYTAISHLKEGEIALERDLKYEFGPEVFGTLTFDANSGKPYSTNNLVGNTKVTGWNGTAVPPQFCHLVAVGDYHGLTVIRQALVKDPPFPYSLASAGRIEGENMEVFGLPEGKYSELPPGQTMIIEEADKEPSHIVSNSTGPTDGNSIVLGTGTSVAGDVKAAGLIEVNSGAVVQGNVLPNSNQQNLPTVDFAQLDPQGKDHTYTWDNSYESVVGRARHSGNLTVGNLKLAEGMLFVDGDLTVTCTITGKGALVATGKITVTGSMDTHSDHAALVARGDITVRGQGPASSRFQGLVYSEGSIDISRTTIMGAAVSKDDTGLTKLEDVKAIAVPELTVMNLDLHVKLNDAMKNALSGVLGGNSAPIGIFHAGAFTQLAPNGDTAALKALGEALAGTQPGPDTWRFGVMEAGGFTATPSSGGTNFANARESWRLYLEDLASAQGPEIIEIFNIDLNTLISMDVDLEMMYHTTVPSEN